MPLSSGLIKPCYVFAPQILLKRVGRFLSGDRLPRENIQLPWGCVLEINGQEGIGRELSRQNIFDIAVSEVTFRILKEGDRVIDVGANIGYMSSLFAMRAGAGGVVMTFEPHPRILERLRRNVAGIASNSAAAPIIVYDFALGRSDDTGTLIEPAIFESNEGAAMIAADGASPDGNERRYHVKIKRLDSVIDGDNAIALLKVDVEGFEPEVLAGAEQLLSRRLIHNIVYEAHDCERSSVHPLLAGYGYSIFGIGHSLFGLRITAGTAAPLVDRSWESPSYLATLHPEEVIPLLASGGWRVLRRGH